MTELKTRRDPLLPSIPPENEWKTFSRVEQWRRSNLVVMRQLHSNVNTDLNTLANETANNANDIADVEANMHNAVTSNNSNTAGITVVGQELRPFAKSTGPIYIFPWEMTSGDGTWAVEMSWFQLLCAFYYNSSNANGNYLTMSSIFGAGSVYLKTVYSKGPDGGILKVKTGTTGGTLYTRDTIDMYAAANSYNHIDSVGYYLAGDNSTIRLEVDGKNASSSGYTCRVTYLSLRRYS